MAYFNRFIRRNDSINNVCKYRHRQRSNAENISCYDNNRMVSYNHPRDRINNSGTVEWSKS